MFYKHTLLPFMAVFAVLLTTNTANAENNGVIFPPTDNTRIYEFPPEKPVAPSFNSVPQAPAYSFGRPYPQQPVMAPRVYAPNYSRRQMPAYGAVPSQRRFAPSQRPPQRLAPPSNWQNRGYPAYPRTNRSNSGFPFGNNMNMPFGNNSGSNFNPFSGNNMPFTGNSFNNPMNNMFGNNRSNSLPFFKNSHSTRKKAWGDERNIWPDFYTDFTDEAWDTAMSGPRDLGEMPGGWRFPYISMPDPVTVSDAITNQFPPIAEEAGNMTDFSKWGVFDNK